jgi:hypothetical protein
VRFWSEKIFGLHKQEILFPITLIANADGFDFLAALLVKTSLKGKFIFDFSNVKRFDPHLSAVIGCIIVTNAKNGASFEFTGLQNEFVKKTLINNGLFELIGGAKRPNNFNSGIPLKRFDMKSELELEKYIYKYLLLTSKDFNLSDAAQKRIFRSIFEIYQNSVMHSGAEEIFVCGHKFVRRGVLALTMVEIGSTFKDNVTTFKKSYSHFSGSQSISWAVKSGNTTKIATETGGLGLDLIREFLGLNHGKLQIRSAEGFWEEKKDVIFTQDFKHNFGGSIVNMEFNLRDAKSYFINEELEIRDIL